MSHAGGADNPYSMGIANFVSSFELSSVPMRSNIELTVPGQYRLWLVRGKVGVDTEVNCCPPKS